MATYRDLEGQLRIIGTLFESSEARQGFNALRAGEREEVLGLSRRLFVLLTEVVAGLTWVKPSAVLDQPSETLFSSLGKLSEVMLQAESEPRWTEVLHDTLSAANWMTKETLGNIPQKLSLRRPRKILIEELPGVESFAFREPTKDAELSAPAVPRPKPSRYANATLLKESRDQPLSPQQPLPTDAVFVLRLDIGELSRESQVGRPEPFPDQALPDEDLWIDIMVSSSHFAVGENRERLGQTTDAHGRLLLPRNGGPARTLSGGRFLYFFLRTPGEQRRGARARVGYYFRGAVVQSQVLIADVGVGEGFRIATDFSISESLADLGAIRARPRVSVFANQDSDGTHQITVRMQGSDGAAVAGTSFELNESTVGTLVGKMRTVLRREDVAPTARKRPRAKLIADLRALAPLGWDLFTAVPGQFSTFLDVLERADAEPEQAVLQVAHSTASGFTFPWTFIYDFPLDSQLPPEKLTLCPLIERWNGQDPLFQGIPRECPDAAKVPHEENILCPFGFWGFRYSLEQIAASDKPVTAIGISSGSQIVVGETQYGVDAKQLTTHVKQLGDILTAAFPGAKLQEGKDKKTIRSLLGADLPLVYFYCHGERLNAADPNTYLGVGNREQITAGDLIGWIKTWRRRGKKIWDSVRPLVFINACHSLEINPDTLVSYLSAFVGTARAAGVIGTEVKVHQGLAMEFAQAFFEHFVRDKWTVDRALRQVRLDFLRDGNLFGLLYTPYCWADLALRRVDV
jgi:CHAT domain